MDNRLTSKDEAQIVTYTDEEKDYLKKSITENLVHARHVESQRLTLLAAFLATTGAVLGLVAKESVTRTFALFSLGVLVFFGLVTIYLFHKWHGVFNKHWNAASDANDALLGSMEHLNSDSTLIIRLGYRKNPDHKHRLQTGFVFLFVASANTLAMLVLLVLSLIKLL